VVRDNRARTLDNDFNASAGKLRDLDIAGFTGRTTAVMIQLRLAGLKRTDHFFSVNR